MSGPMMFNDPPIRTEAMLGLFRTVQRRLLLLTGAVAVLSVLVGFVVARMPGVWGALLAAGLGLVFTFTTVATLRWLVGRGPELLQIVLIGGWLIKMVLVLLLMLWLSTEDFYHRGVFFVTLVVVVIGAVVIEMGSVATARIPAVEPHAPVHSSEPCVTRVTPASADDGHASPAVADPRDLADDEAGADPDDVENRPEPRP